MADIDILAEEAARLKERGKRIMHLLHPDEHLEAMDSLMAMLAGAHDTQSYLTLWQTWCEIYERAARITV